MDKRIFPLIYFLVFYLIIGMLIFVRLYLKDDLVSLLVNKTSGSYEVFKHMIFINYIVLGVSISFLILLFQFKFPNIKGVTKISIFYLLFMSLKILLFNKPLLNGISIIEIVNFAVIWVVIIGIYKLIQISGKLIKRFGGV